MGDLIKEIIIQTETGVRIIVRADKDNTLLNAAGTVIAKLRGRPVNDGIGKITWRVIHADGIDQIPDEP